MDPIQAEQWTRLTVRQRQLLLALVGNYHKTDQPVCFTPHLAMGGEGISFPNGDRASCTEQDLGRLRSEMLTDWKPPRVQPTAEGIALAEAVQRTEERINQQVKADPLDKVKNDTIAIAFSDFASRRGSVPDDELLFDLWRDYVAAPNRQFFTYTEFFARIKERLNQQAPAEARLQASNLSTTGSPRAAEEANKYPQDFPQEARSHVEAERLRAGQGFRKAQAAYHNPFFERSKLLAIAEQAATALATASATYTTVNPADDGASRAEAGAARLADQTELREGIQRQQVSKALEATPEPAPPSAEVDESTKSNQADPHLTERGKIRSAWLDQKLAEHPGWTSDTDIAAGGGPVYNTIQRYRSGVSSTRDMYVRRRLARAFQCEIAKVPA